MKNQTLLGISRILLGICGFALIAVLFLPLWRIDLIAPQYPEGLRLLIFANKLAGNVDIINGLNHYIGMKTLHTDDFIEFKILPYLVGFFSLSFIIVAFIGRKKPFYLLFILFICFGILSMYDFWRWEYNYGHDLMPDAAIVVPGMAYQPPLIGFKQLLNFGAYSFPDFGGWIFIVVGILSFLVMILEWRKKQKLNHSVVMMILITVIFSSCNTNPEKIVVGSDHCYSCKMRIIDAQFGAEIITPKGRIFKFDDAICLKAFLKEINATDNYRIYLVAYAGANELIEVKNAVILQSSLLRGPMGGDIAVFQYRGSIPSELRLNGKIIEWNEFLKS
jgi:copper chaperone NosL